MQHITTPAITAAARSLGGETDVLATNFIQVNNGLRVSFSFIYIGLKDGTRHQYVATCVARRIDTGSILCDVVFDHERVRRDDPVLAAMDQKDAWAALKKIEEVQSSETHVIIRFAGESGKFTRMYFPRGSVQPPDDALTARVAALEAEVARLSALIASVPLAAAAPPAYIAEPSAVPS